MRSQPPPLVRGMTVLNLTMRYQQSYFWLEGRVGIPLSSLIQSYFSQEGRVGSHCQV
jgi:hypothetical protein